MPGPLSKLGAGLNTFLRNRDGKNYKAGAGRYTRFTAGGTDVVQPKHKGHRKAAFAISQGVTKPLEAALDQGDDAEMSEFEEQDTLVSTEAARHPVAFLTKRIVSLRAWISCDLIIILL